MEEDEINLKDIEKEEINWDEYYCYIPERFNKCFIPQNDIAKEIKSIALKLILFNIKYFDNSLYSHHFEEVYLISKIWYKQFEEYSRTNTMKRIIKSYGIYECRPIIFNPDPNKFPGKIFFENLFIKNKIGQNNKNILISKYNDCFDTKLNYKEHFKILTKEEFKLLYNYFGCESNYAIKLNRNKLKLYFSVHLKIALIPTISCFKSINLNEIEKFIKEHKIIYDVYFKLSDDRNAILKN